MTRLLVTDAAPPGLETEDASTISTGSEGQDDLIITNSEVRRRHSETSSTPSSISPYEAPCVPSKHAMSPTGTQEFATPDLESRRRSFGDQLVARDAHWISKRAAVYLQSRWSPYSTASSPSIDDGGTGRLSGTTSRRNYASWATPPSGMNSSDEPSYFSPRQPWGVPAESPPPRPRLARLPRLPPSPPQPQSCASPDCLYTTTTEFSRLEISPPIPCSPLDWGKVKPCDSPCEARVPSIPVTPAFSSGGSEGEGFEYFVRRSNTSAPFPLYNVFVICSEPRPPLRGVRRRSATF